MTPQVSHNEAEMAAKSAPGLTRGVWCLATAAGCTTDFAPEGAVTLTGAEPPVGADGIRVTPSSVTTSNLSRCGYR